MTVDTTELCPVCHGTGKAEAAILVIDKIEDELEFFVYEKKNKRIILKVHPFCRCLPEKRITVHAAEMGFPLSYFTENS